MPTNKVAPHKVAVTISITKEALDIAFDNGYASQRTLGEFLSRLVVEYHARQTRPLTHAEIIAEIRRLLDRLDQAGIDD